MAAKEGSQHTLLALGKDKATAARLPLPAVTVGATLHAPTPILAAGQEMRLADVGFEARVTAELFENEFWLIHMTAVKVEYMILAPPRTTVVPLPERS